MNTQNGIGEGSGAMHGSTLSVPDFIKLLKRCGFQQLVRASSWYTKQSTSVGPVYYVCINPFYDIDGCQLQQNTGESTAVVDIRMPQTEEEFRILCRALGVELNA